MSAFHPFLPLGERLLSTHCGHFKANVLVRKSDLGRAPVPQFVTLIVDQREFLVRVFQPHETTIRRKKLSGGLFM